MLETKPGIRTTEFWTTIATNILGIVQLSTGTVDVNNKYVAVGLAIVNGLYSASRGLAKTGQPYSPPGTDAPSAPSGATSAPTSKPAEAPAPALTEADIDGLIEQRLDSVRRDLKDEVAKAEAGNPPPDPGTPAAQ